MKIKILLFFVLLPIGCAYGQYVNLGDSAFNNYHNGNYLKSIKFYKQILAKNKLPATLYDLELLSLCYEKTDSIKQEKEVLEQLINANYTEGYYASFVVTACRQLADVYFKEKNYQKALSLYKLHKLKWEAARFDDVNHFGFCFANSQSLSKCYEGLRLKDSAVNVLIPYIFCSYRALMPIFSIYNAKTNVPDSLKHNSVCMRYLTLLKKVHNINNIKAELKRADESFTYKQTLKSGADSTFVWVTITCDFDFYGIHISYVNYQLGNKKPDILYLMKQPVYSKERFLKDFYALPLHRMIANM